MHTEPNLPFSIHDEFDGVILETCKDHGISRPRVRPYSSKVFPQDIRVEFPRNLREEHPIGTRFIADLKVLQKTSKSSGELIGAPYLRVDTKTIQIDSSFVPQSQLMPIRQHTKSDRVYTYGLDEGLSGLSFLELRSKLLDQLDDGPLSFSISEQKKFDRSKSVVTYALSRANGICEGCDQQAPFLRKNGEPYLEVHHIKEVASGGSDALVNVIALCPNCHRRVTHGQDKTEYNQGLKNKIIALEQAIGQRR